MSKYDTAGWHLIHTDSNSALVSGDSNVTITSSDVTGIWKLTATANTSDANAFARIPDQYPLEAANWTAGTFGSLDANTVYWVKTGVIEAAETSLFEFRVTEMTNTATPIDATPNIGFSNNNVMKLEIKCSDVKNIGFLDFKFNSSNADIDNAPTMNFNSYLNTAFLTTTGSLFGDSTFSTSTGQNNNIVIQQSGEAFTDENTIKFALDTWTTLIYFRASDNSTNFPTLNSVVVVYYPDGGPFDSVDGETNEYTVTTV